MTRVSAGIYSYNTGAVSCLVCKRGCGRVFSFSLRVCHVPRLSLCLNAFYVSASLFLSVCLCVCVRLLKAGVYPMQSRGAGGFPVAAPFACLVSTETGNPIRQAETEGGSNIQAHSVYH